MPAMQKNSSLAMLVLIAPTLLNQACGHGALQIEYIFPDGFRGPAVIRENQKDRIPTCEVPWLPRAELCKLQFPASGALNVQGRSPGTEWHRASAHYANGTVIPVPDSLSGITVSKDEIALWSFGSVSNGEDWLFVGTEDEFRKFRDEKHK